MTTEEQFQRFLRLPQWAQREMERMTADIAYLRGQLQTIQAADGPVYHTDYTNKVGIPDRNIVVLEAQGGKIEVALRSGLVRVNCNNGALRIQPEAANTMTIWSERFNRGEEGA